MSKNEYKSLITKLGKTKIAQAIKNGSKIDLKTIKIGDGNGSSYEVSDSQTALKRVRWTGNIGDYEQNKNELTLNATIPTNIGGFYMRELGLFDSRGDLIVIGKYPETYKPVSSDASVSEILLSFKVVFDNTDAINVVVDGSKMFVDERTFDREINKREFKTVVAKNKADAENKIALLENKKADKTDVNKKIENLESKKADKADVNKKIENLETKKADKTDVNKKIADLEVRKLDKSEVGDSLKDVAKKQDITDLETHIDDMRVGENLLVGVKYDSLEKTNCSDYVDFVFGGEIPLYNLGIGDKVTFTYEFLSENYIDDNIFYIGVKGVGNITSWGKGELNSSNTKIVKLSENRRIGTTVVTITGDHLKNESWKSIRVVLRGKPKLVYASKLKVSNLKVEIGSVGTYYSVSNQNIITKVDELKEDLIDQATETRNNFDKVIGKIDTSNELYANAILGDIKSELRYTEEKIRNANLLYNAVGDWNEGREITKGTDFSFASPFVTPIFRFEMLHPNSNIQRVLCTYKFKFKDIPQTSKATLITRLREKVGSGYGEWEEFKTEIINPVNNTEYSVVGNLTLNKRFFENNNNFAFDFRLDGVKSGRIFIKDLKLEHGWTKTTWNPNERDLIIKLLQLEEDLVDQSKENKNRFDTIDNKELVLEKISNLIKTTVTSDGSYIKDRLKVVERGINTIISAVTSNSNKLTSNSNKLDKIEKLIEAENKKFSALNDNFDSLLR